MIGSQTVSCGRNGRWIEEFPTCQKRKLCKKSTSFPFSDHLIEYSNLGKFDNKDVAIIDSLANYSCASKSKDNKTIIGSSLRACTITGQWSGTEPLCIGIQYLIQKIYGKIIYQKFELIIDPKTLPKSAKSKENDLPSLSAASIFIIVIFVLFAIIVSLGGLYYGYRQGIVNIPNIAIPKINIQSTNNNNSIPNNYGSTVETQSEPPTFKSTKINEDLPEFPTGSEFLVEPDSSNA